MLITCKEILKNTILFFIFYLENQIKTYLMFYNHKKIIKKS